jgi:hypothetical protein
MQGAEAVVALLCWVVVGAVAGIAVFGTARAVNDMARRRHSSTRAVLYTLLGLVLLGMGLLRHVLPADTMCCGSDPIHIQEALGLAR